MKPSIKKKVKWFLLALLLIFLISIMILGICYLKVEKRGFFSTGTKIKAFYNSTWEMSCKEVERINNCVLKKDTGLFLLTLQFAASPESKAYLLLNKKRLVGEKCSNQNIFGYKSEVNYGFFDDRLFKIRISGKSYNQKEFDSIIIVNLGKSYGKVNRDSSKDYLQFYSHFKRNQTEIDYWQYIDENKESNFVIDMTYMPIILEINRIAEKEQNSLFK